MSYKVFDAAQHCSGQYPCEEGHEVQAGKSPNQNVQREDFLTALYSNKLIVVAEIASTADIKSNNSV